MVKILITMIAAVVISLPSAAQQERKFIRGGNDLFNKQDFEKAEVEYRKALDTEVKSYEGAFNLYLFPNPTPPMNIHWPALLFYNE